MVRSNAFYDHNCVSSFQTFKYSELGKEKKELTRRFVFDVTSCRETWSARGFLSRKIGCCEMERILLNLFMGIFASGSYGLIIVSMSLSSRLCIFILPRQQLRYFFNA
ncbi:hypothetical protein SDJN02_27392, partial [Cucurbita argyrosperma subsp. argyrosperma]